VNDEVGNIWKGKMVAYLKVPPQHLCGGTEENHSPEFGCNFNSEDGRTGIISQQ
jgi:hypothetical protein